MSSKRPSLAGLARPKPVGNPPAADAPPRSAGRAAPAAAPPAEEDMHAMTVRMSKRTSKALKIRAIDEERPVVDLIRDAIEDYLRRHRG